MRRTLARLLLLALVALPATSATAERVAGTLFERMSAVDGFGRSINFYLSDSATPKPLALVIQGSGCNGLFRPLPDGRMSAVGYHNVFRSIAEDRYRVLAVEKPGARGTAEAPIGGQAEGCPAAFLEEHTVERWATALLAAVAAARTTANVVGGRTLVIGHSEGGVLAARLARLDPEVSHAALLASPGPDPAAELVLWGETRRRPRDDTLAMIERIRATPESTSDFALGHPHRRWSSFLAADPVADLLASSARVFAAQGDADANWPVAAHDALVSRLGHSGRDVTALRLSGADHSLNAPGQRPPEGMAEVFRNILAWAASVP
ncbi:MAG: alpha/beta fold hydrolase [Alphaproteobacteria bacterium]|nr:alpha/beta fold hydrolase [Alphaproteobacteria bacterium]